VPVINLARQRIYKRYRRIVKAGQRILKNTEDEQLHALRIECKKLRYLMEFFASLFPPKKISRLIKQLKKLQNNLGDFNDLCVQEEYLLNIASEMPVTDDQSRKTLLAIGGLVETLDKRRAVVKGEFAQTFTTFAAPENKKLFKELFAAPKEAAK
jgi:CHAD domain-containing protein